MTVPASTAVPAKPATAQVSPSLTEAREILDRLTKETIARLMALLEAAIPANSEDPKNKRLERSLQRDMVEYFTRLEEAIPEEAIEQLYFSLVAQE